MMRSESNMPRGSPKATIETVSHAGPSNPRPPSPANSNEIDEVDTDRTRDDMVERARQAGGVRKGNRPSLQEATRGHHRQRTVRARVLSCVHAVQWPRGGPRHVKTYARVPGGLEPHARAERGTPDDRQAASCIIARRREYEVGAHLG